MLLTVNNNIKILILGIGGGGGHITASLEALISADYKRWRDQHEDYAESLLSIDCLACDTNQTSLMELTRRNPGMKGKTKLFGEQTTGGNGASDSLEIATRAYEESRAEFAELFEPYHIIFIIATLGKSTGMASIFPATELARQARKMVFPVIALPSVEDGEVDFTQHAEAQRLLKSFNQKDIGLFQINNKHAYGPGMKIANAYNSLNIPLAKALFGLVRFFALPGDVDLNDFSRNIYAGKGRFYVGNSTLRINLEGDDYRSELEQMVNQCTANPMFERNHRSCDLQMETTNKMPTPLPGGTLVCIQGGNVMESRQLGQLKMAVRGHEDGNPDFRPYFATFDHPDESATEVPITVLYKEAAGAVHTTIPQINWPQLVDEDAKERGQRHTQHEIARDTSSAFTPAEMTETQHVEPPAIDLELLPEPVITTTSKPAEAAVETEPVNAIPAAVVAESATTLPPSPPAKAFSSLRFLLEQAKHGDSAALTLLAAFPAAFSAEQQEQLPFLSGLQGKTVTEELQRMSEVISAKKELSEGWKALFRDILKRDNITFAKTFKYVDKSGIRNKAGVYELKGTDTIAELRKQQWLHGAADDAMERNLTASCLAQAIFGPDIFSDAESIKPVVNGLGGKETAVTA